LEASALDVVRPGSTTGKLSIGKLSKFIGVTPINSDKFIGFVKYVGWLFSFNSDKFTFCSITVLLSGAISSKNIAAITAKIDLATI
jgi:hypothetical protein